MKKSVIGVVPLVDYEKESWWMLPGYMEGILEAGGFPVMLPLTQDSGVIGQILESVDGLLLTGGQDVSPEFYGEERLDCCKECSPERDRMEDLLLKGALQKDLPVLGICRGIQFLNAALGGTLYQDIPSQYKTGVTHCQRPPYDVPAHEVELTEGGPLHRLLGCVRLPVNSYHHQAVKKLAPPLKVMAVSEDGLTEGVYMPDRRFVWAVQWHPEFSWRSDENSRKILKEFVRRCKNED